MKKKKYIIYVHNYFLHRKKDTILMHLYATYVHVPYDCTWNNFKDFGILNTEHQENGLEKSAIEERIHKMGIWYN